MTNKVTSTVQNRAKSTTSRPSVADFALARLTEYSTWAGLLTIGATFATGGAADWLNQTTLPPLLAGLGLLLTKEGQ